MKKEETDNRNASIQLAASLLLALCLLTFSIVSFSPIVQAQETNDQDEDGMDDTWEDDNNLNSSDPSDADLDPDHDGLTNLQEFTHGTDPALNDTDEDEMPDGWEVENGLDPLVNDADGDPDSDFLPNLREYEIGTDPQNITDPGIGDDDDVTPVDDDDNDGAPIMASEKEASSIFCIGLIFILVTGTIILIVGMGIYSKIKKKKLMDHETRVKIVEFLKENPGAYYTQIKNDLGLAHGVLTHHINMLEQQEVLFSKQDRSYRRFYLDGMYSKGPIVIGKQKEVLDMVRRFPGSSQSEIGRKLGLGRMIVSYHINQLEQLALIIKEKHGRENLIHPVDLVTSPISKVEEDPFPKGIYEGGVPEVGTIET